MKKGSSVVKTTVCSRAQCALCLHMFARRARALHVDEKLREQNNFLLCCGVPSYTSRCFCCYATYTPRACVTLSCSSVVNTTACSRAQCALYLHMYARRARAPHVDEKLKEQNNFLLTCGVPSKQTSQDTSLLWKHDPDMLDFLRWFYCWQIH